MVLDHSTGFPNWRWYDEIDPTLNVKRGDMYMIHSPGTFSYSGEGYHYLAKVVAHLNGLTLKNLDSLFQREVAIPTRHSHGGDNGGFQAGCMCYVQLRTFLGEMKPPE